MRRLTFSARRVQCAAGHRPRNWAGCSLMVVTDRGYRGGQRYFRVGPSQSEGAPVLLRRRAAGTGEVAPQAAGGRQQVTRGRSGCLPEARPETTWPLTPVPLRGAIMRGLRWRAALRTAVSAEMA